MPPVFAYEEFWEGNKYQQNRCERIGLIFSRFRHKTETKQIHRNNSGDPLAGSDERALGN